MKLIFKAFFIVFVVIFSCSNLYSQKLDIKELVKVYNCRTLSKADSLLEIMGYTYFQESNNRATYCPGFPKKPPIYQVGLTLDTPKDSITTLSFTSKKVTVKGDYDFYKNEISNNGFKLSKTLAKGPEICYYYEKKDLLLLLIKMHYTDEKSKIHGMIILALKRNP